MYTVYSTTNGKRVKIHDSFVSDARIKLIDPELELSGNSPGSLTFMIPPNHIAYGDYDIVDLSIVKTGEDANNDSTDGGLECVYRGEVNYEEDLYGIKNAINGDTYAVKYKMLECSKIVTVDEHEVAVQPDDWTENYTSYWMMDDDYSSETCGTYIHVPAGSGAPTYEPNKYYTRQERFSSVPDFSTTPIDAFMCFGYKNSGSSTNPVYISPFELCTSEEKPLDWDKNYYISYFIKDGDSGLYSAIPQASAPPEYEPNRYYVREWRGLSSNAILYKERVDKLDLVERMISEITVYRLETDPIKYTRYEKEIWSGRVISEEVDWNGCRKIYCEGCFGYLNDTLQPQKVFSAGTTLRSFLRDILNAHNAKAKESHQFILSVVQDVVNGTDADGKDVVLGEWTTDHGSTMEVLSALVEKYGGYFKIDPPDKGSVFHKISYLRDAKNIDSAETKEALIAAGKFIQLGKNLLDFTKKWDMSSLVTSIIPAGATKNGNEVAAGDVADGKTQEKNKVIAQENKYSYALTTSQPANWASTYFNYYVESDTTKTGVKKVSKSRSGAVPSWAPNTYYYRDERAGDGVRIMAANSSYQIIRYSVVAGNNYYVTTTIDKDHYAYAFTDSSGNILPEGGHSTKATKTTVLTDKKVTIPTGATRMVVCGYGSDCAISLKKEAAVSDDFDRRWRITDHPTDGEWHELGSAYISNPTLVSKYGYIERQVTFDSVNKADSETDASVISRLYAEAKKYLQSTQFDQMSLEVTAADLRILGVAYKGIDLYDLLYVKSQPHGLDKIFPVTEMTIPLSHPEEQTITLGYETDSTISGVTVSTASGMRAEVAAIPSQSSTLKKAKERAAEVVFEFQGGAVYFEDNSGALRNEPPVGDGKIQAICIVDNANTPTKMWRFGLGGLGFRSRDNASVEWSDPAVAITNEGKIVADFVSTGNLDAERINGGTLTLGGAFGSGAGARRASHMEIKESQNNIDSLVASAGVDGYKSYGQWTNNKAEYTRIDDGYLTGGEATRNSSGNVNEYEYGMVRPYAQNVHGSRTGVLIRASQEGSEDRGYIFLDGKLIGVRDGNAWTYGASGSFTDTYGRTITVVNGLITNIPI